MTDKKQPGFHVEDATRVKRGDTTGAMQPSEGAAQPQEASPAAGGTLDPNVELRPTDETQVPPKTTTPRVMATPVKPAIADTLVAAAPVEASPQDATLDPNDPQAKAYEQAVQQATPGAGLGHGASFGDYQLIEPIAKGGMGIVYKARQRKLNRVVAIKMILAGQFADSTDVDRFYAEAEAAAALTHPNIVAIHEIGEVNGQHFFSMDYIEGQSLAGMVRENPFTPQRAAEYVKTIAETMQFAHDHGIVHRDLKPSNILIDKQLRPLITDFGLAKQVSNTSQLTMSGAIIGTPSYMPPEQAAGDGDRVGYWSDIYSTGAILYELLTGRPPFRAASPFETVRQVIETEPLSPRLVNPSVPKDLETICLKCLQKEPAKRYATSTELGEELGRFLKGDPIHARPIGRVERLWRLCKRYPVSATAIAMAIVCLVIGTISVTVGYIQTSRALVAEKASFREQMNAVNDLFTLVSEDTLLNQPGMQPLRKELLKRALAYYDRFLKERASDPTVQDELAAAYFRVGLITEALESTDKALPAFETAQQIQHKLVELAPRDPERLEAYGNTLNALGAAYVKKKQYRQAHQYFDEAVQVRTTLAGLQPAHSEFQRMLANTRMNIGLAEYNAGKLDPARKQFELAQQIRAQTLQSDPQNLKLRRDMGKGAYNLGQLEFRENQLVAAEAHFQEAIKQFQLLTEQLPEDLEQQQLLVVCLRSLGDLLAALPPRAKDARSSYQQALARLVTLARENPDVLEYQHDQASVLLNVGYLEADLGQKNAAIAAYEQARDVLKPLVEKYPNVVAYSRDLAMALRELGRELGFAQLPKATQNMQESINLLETLTKKYPQEKDFAVELEETKQQLKELRQ